MMKFAKWLTSRSEQKTYRHYFFSSIVLWPCFQIKALKYSTVLSSGLISRVQKICSTWFQYVNISHMYCWLTTYWWDWICRCQLCFVDSYIALSHIPPFFPSFFSFPFFYLSFLPFFLLSFLTFWYDMDYCYLLSLT